MTNTLVQVIGLNLTINRNASGGLWSSCSAAAVTSGGSALVGPALPTALPPGVDQPVHLHYLTH
jgi:hypothetical protein